MNKMCWVVSYELLDKKIKKERFVEATVPFLEAVTGKQVRNVLFLLLGDMAWV